MFGLSMHSDGAWWPFSVVVGHVPLPGCSVLHLNLHLKKVSWQCHPILVQTPVENWGEPTSHCWWEVRVFTSMCWFWSWGFCVSQTSPRPFSCLFFGGLRNPAGGLTVTSLFIILLVCTWFVPWLMFFWTASVPGPWELRPLGCQD